MPRPTRVQEEERGPGRGKTKFVNSVNSNNSHMK
jgi:hypothetical protein